MLFQGISDHLVTGSPQISPNRLVLAYDMGTRRASGELKDFSGRGNDGWVVGTEKIRGPFGAARGFRTASDYVGLPFGRSLHIRGPLSIAVWVKFRRLGVHQHIVAYDDLYTLWIDENDRFRFSDTRGNAFESAPGLVPVDTWTSLVATFNGRRGRPLDATNIALYVNGRPAPGRAFGVWDPGPPIEGYVGKESHEGQFYLPFLGDIATVLIFRRALSPAEALAFAAAPNVAADIPLPTEPLEERRFVSSGIIGRTPRVVRISSILPPYRVRTLELLQASPVIRFEQWVMAASERNRKWGLPRGGPTVRIFRDWGVDLSHRDMAAAHFNPGILWELAVRPPDFVILGGYEQPTCLSAALVLERMGIPFLLSSESISFQDSVIGRQAPFLVRKLVRRCAGVIVPGRASRDHFLALGVRKDRIFVAPNAVDVDRFAPPRSFAEKRASRTALGLPDKTLCLYVGRLTRTKGIMDLLDAFGSLQPAGRGLHLVIVGQGLLKDAVEARIRRDPSLRGAVTRVGYASEEQLPEYYRACDMFVFPTRRDIWGLVLNEAMCAGMPVISTDAAAGTLDLIVGGVNGLIVPSERPEELGAAILRFHEDPALRARMGIRARERILDGFTPRDQAIGFHTAIVQTLQRHPNRRRPPSSRC